MNVAGDILWAGLPVPALIVGTNERIEAVNPVAEQFMETSARMLKDQPIWDRLAVDAPLDGAIARVCREGTALFVTDVDVTTGNRAPFQCSLQIAPLADEGDHALILITSHEIVDRLDRAHSTKSSARSAIGMAEMLAHEIKNPLAGITGAAQLLSMSLEPAGQELTELIVEESRRIVKLLNQVEFFGNLSPPECRALNIHDVLDSARKSASVGFAGHMEFSESYDPSLPPTWADSDQLLQVMLNLLKNAAEANPGGGTIHLHTYYDHMLRLRHKDGPDVARPLTIEITDNGPGISPEISADIFDPFVSGRENGTGLGLALVSKIISDHKGWIGVESTPGKTTFRISLPLAPKGA